MNNRKLNIALGLLSSVLAIVSILVLFATAFGDTGDSGASFPSSMGSGFDVMFGSQGYSAVPLLIVAFVLQCVAAVVALIGGILPGKLGLFGFGITALLLVIAGIFWLCGPSSFQAINNVRAEKITNGTGTILAGVFCFVGALLSAYGGYRNAKA